MRQIWGAIIICISVVSFSFAELMPVSLEEMISAGIKNSDAIVSATVIDKKSFKPEDPGNPYPYKAADIITATQIKVDRYLKGNGAHELTVITEGGVVDGRDYWVEDTPRFELGETGYFFLKRHANNLFTSCLTQLLSEDGSVIEKINHALALAAKQAVPASLTPPTVTDKAKEFAAQKGKNLSEYPEIEANYDPAAKAWEVAFSSGFLRGDWKFTITIDDATGQVIKTCPSL